MQKGAQIENIESLSDQRLKIFDSFDLKSVCEQKASFICASQKCSQNAAICKSFCETCRKQHQTCIDAKIAQNIYKSINKKIIELNSEDKSILKQIQSRVDQIIENVSEMNSSVKNQIKLLGLDQADRNLAYALLTNLYFKSNKDNDIIEILQESDDLLHKDQDFCGQTIKQIFQQRSCLSKSWFDQSILRFKQILQKSKQMISSYFDEIQDCLLDLHIKYHKSLALKCYFSNSKILNRLNVTQKNDQTFYNNFEKHLQKAGINGLQFKKIFTLRKSLEQKYSYLHNQLVESIQGKNDLLFLIQNKYYKRFGFFTSLQFNSQNKDWTKNDSKKTIIFSLDANLSELIANPQYLLKYDSENRRISIGGISEKKKIRMKRSVVSRQQSVIFRLARFI